MKKKKNSIQKVKALNFILIIDFPKVDIVKNCIKCIILKFYIFYFLLREIIFLKKDSLLLYH